MSAPRPVSFAERGLWFLHQVAGTELCNVTVAIRIRSRLDHARLSRAITTVVDRHDLLHTAYALVDGNLEARVVSARPELVVDLSPGLTPQDVVEGIRAQHARAFDLNTDTLFRVKVWTLGPEDHVVGLTTHHLAVDGVAIVVCAEEICTLYAADGDPAVLPPLTAPYGEFVAGQRAFVAGPDGDEAWRYWSAVLPAQRPRPPLPSRTPRTNGAMRPRWLPLAADADASSVVEQLAWRHRVPPNLVLLALWLRTLSAVGGRRTIVAGVPRSLRRRRFARTVGCFINNIPVVVEAAPDIPTAVLVEGLRDQLRASVQHQDYPLEVLAQRLPELGSAPGRRPVYDVTFNFVPGDTNNVGTLIAGTDDMTVEIGGLTLSPFPAPQRPGPGGDVSLHITEHPDRLMGFIGYDAALFTEQDAVHLSAQFLTMVRSVHVFDDPNTTFTVVINDEEQYSIWPTVLPMPAGWKTVGVEGRKDECLARIEELWTDMRPLSLRREMAAKDR